MLGEDVPITPFSAGTLTPQLIKLWVQLIIQVDQPVSKQSGWTTILHFHLKCSVISWAISLTLLGTLFCWDCPTKILQPASKQHWGLHGGPGEGRWAFVNCVGGGRCVGGGIDGGGIGMCMGMGICMGIWNRGLLRCDATPQRTERQWIYVHKCTKKDTFIWYRWYVICQICTKLDKHTW